jgi:DNA repair exonuclease SbcCD ATPase subunit
MRGTETLQLEKKELEAELVARNSALGDADEQSKRLDSLSSALEQASNESQAYREDVESLQQEKIELETELESKISALDDACNKLRSSSEQNSVSIQHDKTEIDRLQHALDTSEAALEQLEIAFVECNDKLANYESVNADNQALLEEYQETQRATEDLASNAESRWLETQNHEQIRVERHTEKDLNQYQAEPTMEE